MKKVKIGTMEFQLPFRYDIEDGRLLDNNYGVVAEIDALLIGVREEHAAEVGETIANALNLYAESKNFTAVLVNSDSDESGTIEVTQFDGKWSFRQFGKLSADYPTLSEAITAIRDAELSPGEFGY